MAGYVPSSNLAALYTNTEPGTVANGPLFDPALQDIVNTVNGNYDFVAGLLNTTTLSNMNIYNARNYGAKGDGVADDTVAIQSAIDACFNAGGGTVAIPAGTYPVSTTLVKKNNVSIVGSGKYITTLNWVGANNSSIIDCTNKVIHATYIKGMTLTNTNGVTNNIYGILQGSDIGIYNSTGMIVEDVRFYKLKGNTKLGVDNTGLSMYDSIFKDCLAEYCYYGYHIQGSQMKLDFCRVQNCTFGLVLEYINGTSNPGVQVYNGLFLGNGKDIYVKGGGSTRPCAFYGTWFESCTDSLFSMEATTQIMAFTFSSCQLAGLNTVNPLMDFSKATNGTITIIGCDKYMTGATLNNAIVDPLSSSAKLLKINNHVFLPAGARAFEDNLKAVYGVPDKPLGILSTVGNNYAQEGFVTAVLTGGGVLDTIPVTFPTPFTSGIPNVHATAGGVDNVNVTTGNTSSTGFNLYATKPTAGALSTALKWVAYGKI